LVKKQFLSGLDFVFAYLLKLKGELLSYQAAFESKMEAWNSSAISIVINETKSSNDTHGKEYTTYLVKVQAGDKIWTLSKRYNAFFFNFMKEYKLFFLEFLFQIFLLDWYGILLKILSCEDKNFKTFFKILSQYLD